MRSGARKPSMNAKSLLLAAALALAASGAPAHDYKAGAITINHPWARATPQGASVGAGYFSLTNTGTTPDRLVGGTAAAAEQVELHQMTMVDGVMRMRPVKNGIELAPGQTVEFKSGAFHLMMIDLKQPLQQGQRVKGTLTFEKAGTVDIEFAVEGIGGPARAAPAKDHAH
jgi:periplasmic copper chaperone A